MDFGKNTDLANIKSNGDKLDIDKLENVPSALSNLKSKVDKLNIGKLEVSLVELSKLTYLVKDDVVKKTECDELVQKVNAIQTTDTINLFRKTDYNTKINEIEKKITDHNHSNKYDTTQEFDKLTLENFAARLAQANLASKTDIDGFVKRQILRINCKT